jgi:hypothetical protein
MARPGAIATSRQPGQQKARAHAECHACDLRASSKKLRIRSCFAGHPHSSGLRLRPGLGIRAIRRPPAAGLAARIGRDVVGHRAKRLNRPFGALGRGSKTFQRRLQPFKRVFEAPQFQLQENGVADAAAQRCDNECVDHQWQSHLSSPFFTSSVIFTARDVAPAFRPPRKRSGARQCKRRRAFRLRCPDRVCCPAAMPKPRPM